MTALPRLFLALFMGVWAVGAHAAGPSYRIGVTGVACSVCAARLERELRTLAGVERVEMRLSEEAVLITMQEGVTLDKAAADKVITDAGFRVNAHAQSLRSEVE